MKLYNALRTSCYLMIAIGVLSLSLAERSFTYLVFIIVSCSLHWAVDDVFALSKQVVSIGGFCCMAMGIGDYLFVSGDIIISIAHFLVVIQVVLIFQRRDGRQYGLIYIISFILLAVSAIITTDITFCIPFILFIVAATWTIIIFYLKMESDIVASLQESSKGVWEPRVDDAREKDVPRISKRLFGQACWIAALILTMTLIIFYAIPRFRVGLLTRGAFGVTQPITGFSESVELGEIGRIKENPTKVMNVQLFRENDDEPYDGRDIKLLWRGIALDKYDGRRWTATHEIERVSNANGRHNGKRVTDLVWHLQYDAKSRGWVALEISKEGGNQYIQPFLLGRSPDTSADITMAYAYTDTQQSIFAASAVRIKQRFSLAPINTKLLFSLYPPIRVILFDERIPLTFNIANQSLGVEFARVRMLNYGVLCLYPRLTPKTLRESPHDYVSKYDRFVKSTCTQLPHPMERVKQLAREIAPDTRYPTVYDKSKRIEQYLSNPNNFRYTLNLKLTRGIDPIEDFLFNRRAGHCEYFASAMVIMLRTLDIPARLVNGFSGGEWNNWTKSYIIRQSDAHSWVEVYFPNVGWVAFDPTPAAANARRSVGFVAEVSQFMDFLKAKWMVGVIGYDMREQGRFFRGIKNILSSIGKKLSLIRGKKSSDRFSWRDNSSSKHWRVPNIFERLSFHWIVPKALKGVLGQVATIVIITCLAVVVFMAIKKIISYVINFTNARHKIEASVRFYEDFLKIMLRKGIEREVNYTPSEFARIVITQSRDSGEEEIVNALEAVKRITETFCAVKYGGRILSKFEREDMKKALRIVSCLPCLRQINHQE